MAPSDKDLPIKGTVSDTSIQGAQQDVSNQVALAMLADVYHPLRGNEQTVKKSRVKSDVQRANHANSWTLAIDLATSIDIEGVEGGATRKRDLIFSVAKETKGKPVTLVVQVAEPDNQANKTLNGDHEHSDPRIKKKNTQIATYVIKDGVIRRLEHHKSMGPTGDLDKLMSTAVKTSPDGKMGLVIFAHGHGSSGLTSDNGSVSDEQLADIVNKNLRSVGRKRLDLLDFDACGMGDVKVLEQVGNIADHVVASSENEASFKTGTDGQNLQAAISDLLSNPSMSASQYADEFVRLAQKGANRYPEVRFTPEVKVCENRDPGGTDTLAHYDLSELKQLETAIDNLGVQLTNSSADPNNLKQIKQVIDHTHQMPSNNPAERRQGRDLKLLVEGLLTKVDAGAIGDDHGDLRQALQNVLSAESNLVKTHYGARASRVSDTGGLNVFVPNSNYFSDHHPIKPSSLQLASLSKYCDEANSHSDGSVILKLALLDCQGELKHGKTQEARTALQQLGVLNVALRSALTVEQKKVAIMQIKSFAQTLCGGQLLQELADAYNEDQKAEINHDYNQNSLDGAPHWNQFLQSIALCKS